nr:MAG TPA: hypothetical protein [Caudoviricetes sp.]
MYRVQALAAALTAFQHPAGIITHPITYIRSEPP